MKKQQSGISPYPGYHPSSKEMQLWQQHLMYKQLQQLQRRQQLQQLDQEARPQNLLSQPAARQAAADQLPSLLNGMPINDTSRQMLQSDIINGESKIPISSQMFTANSMNWAQSRGSPGMHVSTGLMLTNDCSQAMHSTGFGTQQHDQSFYGTPVSSSRGLLNQYPQFQGTPNSFMDAMTKAVGKQLEQAPTHSGPSNYFQKVQCGPERAISQDSLSVAAQGFQGKSLFVNAPLQGVSAGITAGNFQQVNHPQQSIQVQVFQDGQEQARWSSNLEEKGTTQVGPSRGVTSLDPTEEKILFGTDDDGNWSSCFGNDMDTGYYLHADPFETNDQQGAFPSLQSGSWSALMQEAVQVSSSEKGFREEWSGLSFQKTEPLTGNFSSIHNDNAKHQVPWVNKSSQCSPPLSLRPSDSLSNTNIGSPFPPGTNFLHSMRSACEENQRVQTNASHESYQHLSKDDQSMQFDQGDERKILDSGIQAQIKSNNVPPGVWFKHIQKQSIKTADSSSMEFNLQNNQGTRIQQDHRSVSTNNGQPDPSSTGWNKSLMAHGGHFSSGIGPVKSDIGSSHIQSVALSTLNFDGAVNSSNLCANEEMNQHPNSSQNVLGKRVACNSFVRSRGENLVENKQQPIKGQQVRDTSANSAEASMSDSQTSSGMSGWKSVGSRRFQSHSTENFSMSVEPSESPKDKVYSQNMPKSVIQQLNNQGQGHVENSHYAAHDASSMRKGQSTDLQRSINSPEESQYRSTMPRQTSKNMLELLQKADDSRDSSAVASFGDNDHIQSASTGSDHSQHAHEASQKDSFGGRSDFSGQNCKEMTQLASQGNSAAVSTSNLSHMGRQLQLQQQKQFLQQQHIYSLSGRELLNQSVNPPPGSAADIEEHIRLASLLRRAQFSHDAALSSQPAQTTLRTMAGRISPFRLDSPTDANVPGSQFNFSGIDPLHAANGVLNHLRSSSQHPTVETGQAAQACGRSGMSLQSGFSTMLQNAWTNTLAQQVMSGAQHQQLNSTASQPITSTSSRDKSLKSMQMDDDRDKKQVEENTLLGTDSERGRALEEKEEQTNHAAGNTEVGVHGQVLPSNAQQTNYSLLQQMQAMKGADSEANRRNGKRLKGEFGPDSSQTECWAGQGYNCGQSGLSRVPLAGELGASSQSSFHSDINMLSFSSRENEDKAAEKTSQLLATEGLYQNMCLPGQPLTPISNFAGQNEHPRLTPQMARSWLEQYRKYKNGQVVAMHTDQKSAQAASQQFFPSELSARIDNSTFMDGRIETGQFGTASQSTSPSNRVVNESFHPLPTEKSRKRKSETSQLLPWQQVVSLGVQRLRSISMADRDWAQVADRLTEKVEAPTKLIEDGSLMPQARRRLILTTQLMQQLLPTIPSPVLAAKVTSVYESVTYFLAKSALGEACGLISFSEGYSGEYLENENR
ncbi:uncharacterized protein A4U43_C08F17090 [Asparagus officinalis]|nr:uncharacterized protein A4U43_C08F17090 [Asparagus officinalis]